MGQSREHSGHEIGPKDSGGLRCLKRAVRGDATGCLPACCNHRRPGSGMRDVLDRRRVRRRLRIPERRPRIPRAPSPKRRPGGTLRTPVTGGLSALAARVRVDGGSLATRDDDYLALRSCRYGRGVQTVLRHGVGDRRRHIEGLEPGTASRRAPGAGQEQHGPRGAYVILRRHLRLRLIGSAPRSRSPSTAVSAVPRRYCAKSSAVMPSA